MRLSELVLRPLCKPPSRIRNGRSTARGNKKQLVVVQIPQAKTVKEANEIAVQLGLAKHADFAGVDISMANDVLQSLAEHRNDFPELPVLEFIGTVPKFRKHVKDNYGLRVRQFQGAAAVSFPGDERYGLAPAIALNKREVSSKLAGSTREVMSHNQTIRWWSVGTLKGVINHEEGHQIDYFVKGRNDSVLNSLYNQYTGCETHKTTQDGTWIYTSRMARSLSEYGNTSISEFIAEGWAEYRSSANPRPLAKAIGDRMMELYREVARK